MARAARRRRPAALLLATQSTLAAGEPCASPDTLIICAPGKSGTSTLSTLLQSISRRNGFTLIDSRADPTTGLQHADAKSSLQFYHNVLRKRPGDRVVWLSHVELHDWMLQLSDRGSVGVLTILREPVARSRSMYEFFRRIGGPGDPTVPFERCYGLGERPSGCLDDPTRLYGASQHELQIQFFDGIARADYVAACRTYRRSPCPVDEALDQKAYLHNATARLRRVDAIAVLERLDASLRLFELTYPRWFGGLSEAYASHAAGRANSDPSRDGGETPTSVDRGLFESNRYNEADLAFYAAAKAAFEDQVATRRERCGEG